MTKGLRYATIVLMSKYTYTLPVLIVLIAAIGIASWSFLKVGNNPQAPVNKKTTTVGLPLNLPSNAIESAVITYTLIGKLTGIKNSEQTEILTDIRIPNLPKLTAIPDTTQVFDVSQGVAENRVPIESLKTGQKVRIIVGYDIGVKIWHPVDIVVILPD